MGALVACGQLGGALRILQNARSRARAPRPSEDFRLDPYGCSPVRSSRLSPLQAWRSIFCASLQTIKGSILAYVSSCTRCRAARRAPPPLGGVRSRTGGGHARRPRETSRIGRVHVACWASGAAKAMRGRRVHVMNCLEPAWLHQHGRQRSLNSDFGSKAQCGTHGRALRACRQ